MTAFPAKLILVGEFTVIHGGSALAVPMSSSFGKWVKSEIKDKRLVLLLDHLKTLEYIDSISYELDIEEGWQLEINFPEGYGLGSSGVLTAAILKKYGIAIDDSNLEELRGRLSKIEDPFHGKSSGFDALVSYTQKPILSKNGQLVFSAKNENLTNHLNHFRLVDSGKHRTGIIPIKWYLEMMENASFQIKIADLEILNQALINALFHHDDISTTLFEISKLQLEIFKPLIVSSVLDYWQQGLERKNYFVKLCGKGTGGYYLLHVGKEKADYFKDTSLPLRSVL